MGSTVVLLAVGRPVKRRGLTANTTMLPVGGCLCGALQASEDC